MSYTYTYVLLFRVAIASLTSVEFPMVGRARLIIVKLAILPWISFSGVQLIP